MVTGEYIPNLKPCPFCGGKATHTHETNDSSEYTRDWVLWVAIDCDACGLRMKGEADFEFSSYWWHLATDERKADFDSKFHAARISELVELEKKWNNRPPAPDVADLVYEAMKFDRKNSVPPWLGGNSLAEDHARFIAAKIVKRIQGD